MFAVVIVIYTEKQSSSNAACVTDAIHVDVLDSTEAEAQSSTSSTH